MILNLFKNNIKKWIFAVFILSLFLSCFNFVSAQENENEVIFFFSKTCPHCAKESIFLNELEKKYPDIVIKRFLISDKGNIDLLFEFYKKHNVAQRFYGQVPITFIEDEYFLGFDDSIGLDIENCLLDSCEIETGNFNGAELENKINIPFFGEIDIRNYSLPLLAVVLGFLDGFNVCSLGALILILGLVLALKSRKKILIFGGLFIFTSAAVYGFLIILWYQIFSFFMPYLKIMEIIIGLLAIGGGIYFFSQFIKYRKYGPTCEITPGKNIMSKFSSKFQESIQSSGNIFLLITSILLFAVIITIVEFPCSAAVPVIFAGVLANANLSTFFYLFYIALFILFYMLDEIIIFLIAFFTMTVWLSSNKTITWITLIEAIILFALGLYYILGFGIIL